MARITVNNNSDNSNTDTTGSHNMEPGANDLQRPRTHKPRNNNMYSRMCSTNAESFPNNIYIYIHTPDWLYVNTLVYVHACAYTYMHTYVYIYTHIHSTMPCCTAFHYSCAFQKGKASFLKSWDSRDPTIKPKPETAPVGE